jgi:sugar phosphate isomerase/epimerase
VKRQGIAAQFYTLRDFTGTREGFRDSLRRVAEMGYSAVQLSAVGAFENGLTSRDARVMLDENGLRCIATHRPWSRLSQATNAEIDFHHELGCDYAAIGGIAGDFGYGLDDFRRFNREAQVTIEKLKTAGIRFGVHNHAHEFIKFDGRFPFDVWLDEGGADLMLEVDTYWVIEAGIDPTGLLRRCAGRIPVIHVKDREVVREGPRMAAIGEGNMDWRSIIAAGDAGGVEAYVVEQDVCPRDPFDCLRSSFEFLASLTSE